ncbi:MAG: TIM barrel protein, partial [Candidatus Woesearchaeota archaeon]
MKSLLFGTAGIPICTEPRNTVEGIKQVKKLGLGSMELEFVQNVNISKETAPVVKKTAEENNVVLTCHSSYFINLNAKEKEKAGASRQRIIQAATRLFECGGYSCCFHPGFYLGENHDIVYNKIKEQLQRVIKELQDKEIKIWIRPETTGKGTQFGTLYELLKLSQEIEMVMPCIDFSHLHARSNGKMNTYEEFKEELTMVEKFLGKEGLQNLHCHVSGIAYSEKGDIAIALFEFQEIIRIAPKSEEAKK